MSRPAATGRKTKPAKSARATAAARKGTIGNRAKSDAEAAVRRARVFELRRAGFTFRRIAESISIDIATAHSDYHQALNELLPVEHVREMRALELDRMDAIRQALWPQVLKGDYKAIDRYLIMSERSARLAGLDAPTEVNFGQVIEGLNRLLETSRDAALDAGATIELGPGAVVELPAGASGCGDQSGSSGAPG